MKKLIFIISLFVVTSAYAIKIGDNPILPYGIKIGYGVGTSPVSGGTPTATYWNTAYGTDWTVAYGADWTLPYNTEIP